MTATPESAGARGAGRAAAARRRRSVDPLRQHDRSPSLSAHASFADRGWILVATRWVVRSEVPAHRAAEARTEFSSRARSAWGSRRRRFGSSAMRRRIAGVRGVEVASCLTELQASGMRAFDLRETDLSSSRPSPAGAPSRPARDVAAVRLRARRCRRRRLQQLQRLCAARPLPARARSATAQISSLLALLLVLTRPAARARAQMCATPRMRWSRRSSSARASRGMGGREGGARAPRPCPRHTALPLDTPSPRRASSCGCSRCSAPATAFDPSRRRRARPSSTCRATCSRAPPPRVWTRRRRRRGGHARVAAVPADGAAEELQRKLAAAQAQSRAWEAERQNVRALADPQGRDALHRALTSSAQLDAALRAAQQLVGGAAPTAAAPPASRARGAGGAEQQHASRRAQIATASRPAARLPHRRLLSGGYVGPRDGHGVCHAATMETGEKLRGENVALRLA